MGLWTNAPGSNSPSAIKNQHTISLINLRLFINSSLNLITDLLSLNHNCMITEKLPFWSLPPLTWACFASNFALFETLFWLAAIPLRTSLISLSTKPSCQVTTNYWKHLRHECTSNKDTNQPLCNDKHTENNLPKLCQQCIHKDLINLT